MSSAETEQESGEDAGPDMPEPGIAEYDSGVLQLGDTEMEGVPDGEIIERYSDADIDAVVYHGDASKKQDEEGWVSQEDYVEQLESTYESLNRIGEELDADVLTLPGNHEPVAGNHLGDEEYVEEVEELVEEEYEDFTEFDGNAYEFFINSDSEEVENENIMDFTGSVYETADVSLVGLGTHMEPELDQEAYSLLNADTGLEEFGYGEEDLEEAADELSEEPGFEYGFLSDIPLLGDWIEKIGDRVAEMLDYGAKHVEPGDIGLEDLEDLGEEFMTEEHAEYLEQLEEVKESEEYEEFVEKKEKIESLVESAENEVAVFNHSTPLSEENQYGSMALRDVAEEHDLAMIGGGHSHSSGVSEVGGTQVVNAAETYTEIGFGDELYTEQHQIGEKNFEEREGPSEEETEQVRETFEAMEQHDSFEDFWGEQEKMIEEDLQQIDQVDDGKIEEIKEQQREAMEEMWEKKDQLQPPSPDSPGEESGQKAEA